MTTLVILTGPQGSGNHLFSKIFDINANINGWAASEKYWRPHSEETFHDCWMNPSLLRNFDFSISEFWFTSISCPMMKNGEFLIPKYEDFLKECENLGINVKIVIIGRDSSILEYQQQRVRKQITYESFLDNLDFLLNFNPIFVSLELVYLYRKHYVQNLFRQLQVPCDLSEILINNILANDSNRKYFKDIPLQELDVIVRQVSGMK